MSTPYQLGVATAAACATFAALYLFARRVNNYGVVDIAWSYAFGGLASFYALGELSRHAVDAFGAGAQLLASPEAISEALAQHMGAETTVLVKGSRFMRMERVVQLITTTSTTEGSH